MHDGGFSHTASIFVGSGSSSAEGTCLTEAVLSIIVAIHSVRQFSNEWAKALSLSCIGRPPIQFEVS